MITRRIFFDFSPPRKRQLRSKFSEMSSQQAEVPDVGGAEALCVNLVALAVMAAKSVFITATRGGREGGSACTFEKRDICDALRLHFGQSRP